MLQTYVTLFTQSEVVRVIHSFVLYSQYYISKDIMKLFNSTIYVCVEFINKVNVKEQFV